MESFFSLLQKKVLNRRRRPTRDQLRLGAVRFERAVRRQIVKQGR